MWWSQAVAEVSQQIKTRRTPPAGVRELRNQLADSRSKPESQGVENRWPTLAESLCFRRKLLASARVGRRQKRLTQVVRDDRLTEYDQVRRQRFAFVASPTYPPPTPLLFNCVVTSIPLILMLTVYSVS